MPKYVKSWQHFGIPSTPRGVKIKPFSRGTSKGAKMTIMDILEFRGINGRDPYKEIWFK